MGEIAESMLDGSCCEQCGEYLGEAVGYPQCCATCDHDSEREDSQARRASNRENSNRLLRENGYTFDERNGAAHLIVQTQRGIVDFWPGTGKFIVRSTRYEARGVFNLMQHAAPLQPAAPLEIQWKPHMTPLAVRAYVQAGFILVGTPAALQ
ncbi:hypothetical protein [Paraburkholderia antibiotica]|uniref:Uncharacterized protein n=1 Tax=Paraburkholderia antibiotica TaxID=2728839 RepID=A0A7Y0FFU4_9BURK|nr:hypothetical protein [Paraburkholderia antibiotica]NML34546.1 hypothetical protein [Paraburkholderia antibiotica]